MSRSAVRAIQRAFPQIHAACHTHHEHHDADVLAHLDLVLGVRPAELAKHLSMTTTELTSALRRLEKQGLVVRSKSARDSRRTVVKLTDKGDSFTEQPMLDDEHLGDALRRLTAAQRRIVVEGFELLAKACVQTN